MTGPSSAAVPDAYAHSAQPSGVEPWSSSSTCGSAPASSSARTSSTSSDPGRVVQQRAPVHLGVEVAAGRGEGPDAGRACPTAGDRRAGCRARARATARSAGVPSSNPYAASSASRSVRPCARAQSTCRATIRCGRVLPLPQPATPGPAVAPAEPVGQQHAQVAVVAAEHPVVERLPVVRVRAAVEQQPGERLALRVPGLPARALLALAEAAGEHGEGRDLAAEQDARVRVGARRPAAAGRPRTGRPAAPARR